MKSTFLKSVSLAALAALAVLALGGCSSSVKPQTYKGALTFPKNEVEMTTTSHTIDFGMGGSLSDQEKMELEDFLASQGLQYGDQLVLDFAKNDAGWAMKLESVSSFLKTRGYWVKFASQSGAVNNTAQARLNINKYSVIQPDCQALANTTFKPGEMDKNLTFGCITAYNLGAMIANPQDLIEGQPDAGPSTYRSVRALQLYRGRTGMVHLTGGVPVRVQVSGESRDEQK